MLLKLRSLIALTQLQGKLALTLCTPYKTHSLQRSRGGAHSDHKRGGSFNLKFSNALFMQKEINAEVYGVVLALYAVHNLELQELFLKSISHIPNVELQKYFLKSFSHATSLLNLSHKSPVRVQQEGGVLPFLDHL